MKPHRDSSASSAVHRAPASPSRAVAFTLIELLTVIAIIGILAAIALPNLGQFKPNTMAAGARQMLDAVHRARQLAISQRTTVYMVFVPTNAWTFLSGPIADEVRTNFWDKQIVAYNYVSLRGLGDQPGRPIPRYLGEWQSLPQGIFIPLQKFGPRNPAIPALEIRTNDAGGNKIVAFRIMGFSVTNTIPFPSATNTPGLVPLPYLAFNYMGQLVSGQNEQIPLALGAVSFGSVANPSALPAEAPPGNSTNAFNVVNIDWLTGRARLEHPEIQ